MLFGAIKNNNYINDQKSKISEVNSSFLTVLLMYQKEQTAFLLFSVSNGHKLNLNKVRTG